MYYFCICIYLHFSVNLLRSGFSLSLRTMSFNRVILLCKVNSALVHLAQAKVHCTTFAISVPTLQGRDAKTTADPAASQASSLETARAHSDKDESRDETSIMATVLAGDVDVISLPVVEAPEPTVEPAVVTPSAAQMPPSVSTTTTTTASASASSSDRSRLFIVCGRGRKADELHQLFSACGEIKNLHFALDRSSKSRVSPSSFYSPLRANSLYE